MTVAQSTLDKIINLAKVKVEASNKEPAMPHGGWAVIKTSSLGPAGKREEPDGFFVTVTEAHLYIEALECLENDQAVEHLTSVTLRAALNAHRLESGIGDAVLARQLEDELHDSGVGSVEARRGAVLEDGGDGLVGDPGLFRGGLVDRPDVFSAGLTGGGQDGEGLDAGRQEGVVAGIAAQSCQGAAGPALLRIAASLRATPPREVSISSQMACPAASMLSREA